MTLRHNLANGTPTFSPTFKAAAAAWNITAGAVVKKLGAKEGANASVVQSESVNTNPYYLAHAAFVSEPFLRAGTLPITDTIRIIYGRTASGASSFGARLYVYVTAGNSDTVRGVLVNVESTTAWAVTSGNGGWGVRVFDAAVACQAGDRLVVEMGVRTVSTTTAARSATMWYGGTGEDFPEAAESGTQTTKVGWIDFTGVIETMWTEAPVVEAGLQGNMHPFLTAA